MAQYQRFLSYLFEYDGDLKKENCGFAKVEIRGDVQRIYLSVRNTQMAELLHVFGFYRKESGCGCVPLGRMLVKNGKGQLQYVNSGRFLAGSKIRFEQLSGLVAGRQQPFSNAYATVWDDQYFGLSLFSEKTNDETRESEASTAKPLKGEAASEKQEAPENEAAAEDQELFENKKTLEAEEATRAAEAAVLEICSTQKEENPQEIYDEAAQIWEQLSARYPHIETLPGDKLVCLKVMPADIGRLPRQNWMLSSNGFLMYSFVKYRYIVFARVPEGGYELWVPGNYEKSEELMAQMFGFYHFRSMKSQKAGNGDFGYWCVPLSFWEK